MHVKFSYGDNEHACKFCTEYFYMLTITTWHEKFHLVSEFVKVKVKLSLCFLTKHHTMKA
jgi:hypothetical protein